MTGKLNHQYQRVCQTVKTETNEVNFPLTNIFSANTLVFHRREENEKNSQRITDTFRIQQERRLLQRDEIKVDIKTNMILQIIKAVLLALAGPSCPSLLDDALDQQDLFATSPVSTCQQQQQQQQQQQPPPHLQQQISPLPPPTPGSSVRAPVVGDNSDGTAGASSAGGKSTSAGVK